ncbi:Hypp8492 [Branchiostoma lanceolatum]|uniref:Hypp8492 protein n=1 Tax=Branchiostoma lanceolatum TaxID=7740 RepID=A0A8J9Z8W7_BRALA|nr:Hypp8492 [Branchiostoma lanceolatum]
MYKTSQPRPKPNPMYTFQTESQAGPGMKIFTSAQNLSEGQDNKRETEDKADSSDSRSSDNSSIPDSAEAKFSSPLESLVRDEKEKEGEPESSTSRSRSSTSRSKVRGDLTTSAAKLEELNQKTPKEPQGARRRSSSAKSPIHIPGRRRSSFKEAKSRFEQSSPEGRGEREGSQEFVFRDQGVPVYRKRSTSAGVRETETGGRRKSSPSPHRRTNLRQGLWRTRRLDEKEKSRGKISEDDRDTDTMSSDFIIFDEDHYGGDKAKVPKETGEAVLDFIDFEEDHFKSPDDVGYGDKREETQEVTVNFSRESRKSRQEKGSRASGRNEVEIDPPPKAPARRKHSNKSKTNRTGQPTAPNQSDPVAPPRRKRTSVRSPAVEESDLGEPLARSSPMLSRANSVPDFRNPPPFEDETPPPSEYENPLYYRELSMSQRSWDTDSVIAIPTRSPLDGIRKRLSRVGRAFRLCMGRDSRVQRTFSDASTAGMVPKVEDTVD